MSEFEVIFTNQNELVVEATDVFMVEDILLEMGFSSRDIANALIMEVVS